jgi:antitoxin Phd
MKSWPAQDAKARFSEVLAACDAEGPQLVTKRGAEAAVLVPINAWRKLSASIAPSLKDLLLSDEGRFDEARRPARARVRHRPLLRFWPRIFSTPMSCRSCGA